MAVQTLSAQRDILFWLARCDYKLRDQGTALGFLWTLLNPLLMFGVLYLVFGSWFSHHVEHYPLYLLVGIVHWNFFSLATSNAVDLFDRRRTVLKSFPVRLDVVVISAVCSVFISYLIECLIVVAVVSFMYGTTLAGVALFFGLAILNLLLSLGVALILSNFHIFYRDVKHVWSLLLRIGFFLTPVFYPLSVIGEQKLFLLKLNPLFHTFSLSREALITGSLTFSGFAIYLSVFTLLLLAGSTWLIRRNQEKVVELL